MNATQNKSRTRHTIYNVGSHWEMFGLPRDEKRIYRLEAIQPDVDPVYKFRMVLVDFTSSNPEVRKGQFMYVEKAWFRVRANRINL